MKKFKFKLETVLRHRKALKKQAEIKYYDVRKELEEKKRFASYIRNEQIEFKQNFGNFLKNSKGKISTSTLKDYQDYMEYLRRKANEVKKSIELLTIQYLKVKQALINASQNLKIIERIREKAKEDYTLEFNKKEDLFLDELVTMRPSFFTRIKI